MLFHGEAIEIGERIWHIRYGHISVVEVNESYFVAEGAGKRHHVTTDGFTMGAQTCFWHNPWIAIPPKDGSVWTKVVSIASAARNVLK